MDYSLSDLARRLIATAEHADAAWDSVERPSMRANIKDAALRLCGVPHDGSFSPTRESALVELLLIAAWDDAIDWAKETLD